jgi:hypothetical protein
MNIIRGKRDPAEVAPADGVGGDGLSRRRVVRGLVAPPVVYGDGALADRDLEQTGMDGPVHGFLHVRGLPFHVR